eukprot:TRINITY_DN18983_c0_g1_i1.p1 TRINITY_DN18983_c0_g1~~TRINITY_DN18983_c0_g1_i1.p1  ORF type:complete len:1736 (+),score=493.00 TRINITY_DN18983_c0_g1_i1:57-5210(+)
MAAAHGVGHRPRRERGSARQCRHKEEADDLSSAAGVRYEAKDVRSRWWPVKVHSGNADGTVSVNVHDGKGTEWPVVHLQNLRPAPSLRQLSPPPVLVVLSHEREFCSGRYKLAAQGHNDMPYWQSPTGGCIFSTRRRLWAVGTQSEHRDREVGLLFTSHDHGGRMPDEEHRWVHRNRDGAGFDTWLTASKTLFFASQCSVHGCLEVVTDVRTQYCSVHGCGALVDGETPCGERATRELWEDGCYCDDHAGVCQADGCRQYCPHGYETCLMHRCSECAWPATFTDQDSRYCSEHAPRCKSTAGCNRLPVGGKYCLEHLCSAPRCGSEVSIYDVCQAHVPHELRICAPPELSELAGDYAMVPDGALRYVCRGAWGTTELAQMGNGHWCLRSTDDADAGPALDGGSPPPPVRTACSLRAPWAPDCSWERSACGDWEPLHVRCGVPDDTAPPIATPRRDPEGSCIPPLEDTAGLACSRRFAELERAFRVHAEAVTVDSQKAKEAAQRAADQVACSELAAQEQPVRSALESEQALAVAHLSESRAVQCRTFCCRGLTDAEEVAERHLLISARTVSGREVVDACRIRDAEAAERQRGSRLELLRRQRAARLTVQTEEVDARRGLLNSCLALSKLPGALAAREAARLIEAEKPTCPPVLEVATAAANEVSAWLAPLLGVDLSKRREAAAVAATTFDSAQSRCRRPCLNDPDDSCLSLPNSPPLSPIEASVELDCQSPTLQSAADPEATPGTDDESGSPRPRGNSVNLQRVQARDEARARALSAQAAFLELLESEEVAAARKRFEDERTAQLTEWAAALHDGLGEEAGDFKSVDFGEGLVMLAVEAVGNAADAMEKWGDDYASAVGRAAQRTDDAAAVVRQLLRLPATEQIGAVDELKAAADAEQQLHEAGPCAVRAAPDSEIREAVRAVLAGLEVAGVCLQAACAEHAEACVQLKRLQQGEEASASVEARMDELWTLRGEIAEQRRLVRRARTAHEDAAEAAREQQTRPPRRRDPEKIRLCEEEVRRTAGELAETRRKQQCLQKQAQEQASTLWRVAQEHLPEIAVELALLVRGDIESSGISATVGAMLVTRSLDDYDDSELKLLSAPDARLRVVRVRYLGEDTVLKEFPLSSAGGLRDLLRELHMYSQLRHPSIAEALAAFVDDTRGCAFIHFRAYPRDLHTWMAAQPEADLSEAMVVRMVRCLLQGLEHIHGQGLIHADVHDRNIVVDASGLPLFIDFELARVQPKADGDKGQSAVTRIGGRIDFLAPELCVADAASQARARHPDRVATRAADVYSLGKVIQQLLAVVGGTLSKTAASGLTQLAEAMTSTAPDDRPSAGRATVLLARVQERAEDALSNLHQAQGEALDLYRERLEAQGEMLAAAKRDQMEERELLRREADRLNWERSELERQVTEQGEVIAEAAAKVRCEQRSLEEEQRRLRPPANWVTRPDPGAWQLCRLSSSDPTLDSLRACLEVTSSAWLGLGRDQRDQGSYWKLELARAWRLEHHGQWRRYAVARDVVSVGLRSRALVPPAIRVRSTLDRATSRLPGELAEGVNERRLLHGTAPNLLLSILANGLNERFSNNAAFGHGTYLAECAGKADQYSTADPGYGFVPGLHRRLYPRQSDHPGDVHYVLLCRAVLGWAVRTTDGTTRMDPPCQGSHVFASSARRELMAVPDVDPPLPHHSLVAELGHVALRYREFVVFHSEQVYPEYLIAYRRK